MKENTCCVFGHRKIVITEKLKKRLFDIFEEVIVKEKINIFLFGSRSQFDDLCYQIISNLKNNYPFVKRVYVRAEFPYIDDSYREYLLQSYEETYYPDSILNAGKAVYIERNYEMIDKSELCIVYFDEKYMHLSTEGDLVDNKPKSGTKIAYEYALKKSRRIINVLEKQAWVE